MAIEILEDGLAYMPLKGDSFIHFTTEARAKEILKDGKLRMNPPYAKMGTDTVDAVSLVWGRYVPRVQTTHLKKHEASEGPIVGIVFKTSVAPEYGYVEEVKWRQDVPLQSPKIVPMAKAVSLLKGTPSVDDDTRVTYKKASIEQRVATRSVIDTKKIEKLRKDFLVLMKNVPLVVREWEKGNLEAHGEFRGVLKNYRNAFNEIIFDKLLNKEVKDLGRNGQFLDQSLRDPGWDLHQELASYPEKPSSFRDIEAWDKRTRRKAQKFWKEAKYALDRFLRNTGMSPSVFEDEQVVMEGFQVTISNYVEYDYNRKRVGAFNAALRHYKQAAKARMPWLIQHQLPIILDFKGGLNTAGRYHTKNIWVNALAVDNPANTAKILAHEMGHHRFKHLSASAEKFWNTAISGDYGKVDIQTILDHWPGEAEFAWSAAEKLASKYPVLALQIDILRKQEGLNTQEDYERLRADGKETVTVPKTPVSAYGATNPEEAFCEAVGLYVAYGPRAVHPQVQRWLGLILGGEIKTASTVASENEPTDKALWDKAISKAKEKFQIYPSAYANGWAAKWYKEQGGGWKKKEKSKRDASFFSKTTGTRRLDRKWLEGLRKDFLTLTKNLTRIKNYRDADRVREAFHTFAERFDDTLTDFLEKQVRYNLGLSDSDVDWALRTMHKVTFDFMSGLSSFPLSYPDENLSEVRVMDNLRSRIPKWKTQIQRRARKFWDAAGRFFDWYEQYHGKAVEFDTVDTDQVKMEGFTVLVRAYNPSDERHLDNMARLKAGLKHYKQRVSQVAPILFQKQLPIMADFEAKLDAGGQYFKTYIAVWPTWDTNPQRVAHIIAHEMGHHIYKTYLSAEAASFWSQTIKGDFGKLDVRELLAKWPGDAWAYQFSQVLGKTDPVLALQVEAIGQKFDYQSKADFEAALAKGVTEMTTPKTPITGYANKNPEEAFCEALGLLVAYGPRALHERVRWWLGTVLPGAVKVAKGKNDSKKNVGKGGLDEWFAGHGGGKPDERSQWGDWVSISPAKKTLDSGKKVEPGDIVGPCGISNDPDWKDITNNGKDPLKCMPREKAHDMPKKERAEKAKGKQKAEKKDKDNSKKPTRTPTFKDKKTARAVAQRYAASQQLQTLQKLVKEVSEGLRPFISYWKKIEPNANTEKAVKTLPSSASALLKYLEITFEDEERGENLKKHKLFKRINNLKKLVKEYAKIRSFDDAVAVMEKQGTKSKNALQKFAEYADEAIQVVKYFETETVDSIKLENYTATLVNARGREITRDDVQRIAEALKRTNTLLGKAGLGSATGGRLFVYKGSTLSGGSGAGASGATAMYHIPKDVMSIAVDNSVGDLTKSMIHELGHRVYYRVLGGQGRAAWDQFFGDNVKAPDIEAMIKDWESWHAKNESYRGSLIYYLSEGGVDEQTKMFWKIIFQNYGIVDDIDPYGRVKKTKGPSPLEQVKDKKSEIKVFLYPVSAYSGKDSHELFSEVLAYMLVDGPQKVEPIVRDAFGRAVPALKTASRVASRYLEARAIKMDKKEIQDLSKALETVISRKTDGKTPLGQKRLNPRGYPFTVTAVDGSSVPVLIVLDAFPTDSPYYIVDGGVGRASKQVVVVIGINGSKPIPKNTGGMLARQLFPVLLHELTHVADKYKGRGPAQDLSRDEAAESAAYYNNPGEVRAYMQEVVDEASERFPHWDILLRISLTKAKAVDYLLGSSSTWSEVSPYWTPQNKQKVLKAVVQALDDYLAAK